MSGGFRVSDSDGATPVPLSASLAASRHATDHQANHPSHRVTAENWDGGVHLKCSHCTFRMMIRAEID
jgi:hypothetical protein